MGAGQARTQPALSTRNDLAQNEKASPCSKVTKHFQVGPSVTCSGRDPMRWPVHRGPCGGSRGSLCSASVHCLGRLLLPAPRCCSEMGFLCSAWAGSWFCQLLRNWADEARCREITQRQRQPVARDGGSNPRFCPSPLNDVWPFHVPFLRLRKLLCKRG